MPLVNVVPHVVLQQKPHVLVSENFFGRWKWVAAPCVLYTSSFIQHNGMSLHTTYTSLVEGQVKHKK